MSRVHARTLAGLLSRVRVRTLVSNALGDGRPLLDILAVPGEFKAPYLLLLWARVWCLVFFETQCIYIDYYIILLNVSIYLLIGIYEVVDLF